MKKIAPVFFVLVLVLASVACDDGVIGKVTDKNVLTGQWQMCQTINNVLMCNWYTTSRYVLYINSTEVQVDESGYSSCDVGEIYPACVDS